MNLSTTYKEISNRPFIDAAVNYWSQFLVNEQFGVGNQRIESSARLWFFLHQKESDFCRVTLEQFLKFRLELAKLIEKKLKTSKTMQIDPGEYGTDDILSQALANSSLGNVARFPEKIVLIINMEKGVRVEFLGGEVDHLYVIGQEQTHAIFR